MSKKRIAVFSFIHFVILAIFFVISFSVGMDEFDEKDEMSAFEEIAQMVTVVLMSPLYLLWNSWASKHIHNLVENILFITNSVVWGVAIEYLYSKIKYRHGST